MGLSEKCGVFGIYGSSNDVARFVYYGLWTLQHRGQESSGIASTNGKKIFSHKGHGLVASVYTEPDLDKLKGHIAIGHNRYSTFGKTEFDHTQPVYDQHDILALAHNGNLPVVNKLRAFLSEKGIANTNLNDSEMMYEAIKYWVVKEISIENALRLTFPLFNGAFSLLIMTKNELVAVRDEFGIRPLSIGKLNDSYVFASETCAFDAIGAEFIRDVEPGEMVIADKNGLTSHQLAKGNLKFDVFEFIYFARPDSILMGKSVYEVRKNLGRALAKEVKSKIDLVVPVPDSSIPSAIGYSEQSTIPLEHAFIKNRYIHRTFIKPSQTQRNIGVQMKLNLIKGVVKGKSIGIVDDSVVRGTTSKRIIKMVRDAGAKEVHLLITSPPVYYPDFYGIDTPNQKELVAAKMSLVELAKYLEADSVNFLSFNGMIKAIGIKAENLNTSCFDGVYPINIGVNLKKIKIFANKIN